MIAVIDYGMGNLLSVLNALDMCGADAALCDDPAQLAEAERIVLPGVGAFGDCISSLERTGFVAALHKAVLKERKPILGICLGMQVMARRGLEGGEHKGLGWFDADVVRISPSDSALKIPHVGWNNLELKSECPIFAGLPQSPDCYFVHSYHMVCDDPTDTVAVCDYGGPVTAAVLRDNIFATQFHPEKSQDIGLNILEHFLDWKPKC